MYKKMLTIILAIALITTLGTISVSAHSVSICNHTTAQVRGGYVSGTYDASLGQYGMYHVYGNSYTYHATLDTTAEIYSSALGRNYLNTASAGSYSDAYTETVIYANVDYAAKEFSCGHSVIGARAVK